MNRFSIAGMMLGVFLLIGQSPRAAKAVDSAPFHVLAMAEPGGVHAPFVAAAKIWLADQGAKENFTVDYIENADKINEEFLSHYQVFLQLNYPPYAWNPTAMAAFQKYMTEGRGGWVGLHHASLIGDFDGYHPWPWFRDTVMGGITWKDYIPKFASGKVNIEDPGHPVMDGVPSSFTIKKEEWYTYDKSPRAGVRVIASVDESSYVPDGPVKMGDHPVIWTSDQIKARNVYIFMGHSPVLFDDEAYKKILNNAILWAAGRKETKPTFKVLAFYNMHVEPDHVSFAKYALDYFGRLGKDRGFTFDSTQDWAKLNSENLKNYQVVVWLNDSPHDQAERQAFEQYMENGGAWLGFHVAGYNDKDTHWPWFVQFMGGAVFNMNNWPPLPAKLTVDTHDHPVTHRLPDNFIAPTNEWYQWLPSPRLNKDVKVLVTLDPSNYPLGRKDFLTGGDTPVVWTNTRYKMVYMNQGHIFHVFENPVQNQMYDDAILWLGGRTQ